MVVFVSASRSDFFASPGDFFNSFIFVCEFSPREVPSVLRPSCRRSQVSQLKQTWPPLSHFSADYLLFIGKYSKISFALSNI